MAPQTVLSEQHSNDNQPTMESLFDIAEALGMDVRELLVGNKP